MLHVAFAACNYIPHPVSLPPENPSNTTSALAQAQSLQEIEQELLWEIKASVHHRGLKVGLKEGQRIGFQDGLEAGMVKGLEQGHREGYHEGRFGSLRDGYQEGQHDVSQAVLSLFNVQMAVSTPRPAISTTVMSADNPVTSADPSAVHNTRDPTSVPTQ
ncbi:hypothetical protein EWM64_g1971 [Hericium alpestre]|uniref:Essential protein Yae1 N-terminal domain-containing protein n=1 Tax=Hericium alpestre TaxID=135208 RepID=A0A4Z0A5P4_9AGAM|nr:hypothetical protein EWM64_g1971 [Hericium alpestre]